MNNSLYPEYIFDNNVKNYSKSQCAPKKEKHNMPHRFEARAFYPHSAQAQNAHPPQNNHHHNNHHNHNKNHNHNYGYHNHQQQSHINNYDYAPPNYTHEPRQPYNYNDYVQANSYNQQPIHQNNQWHQSNIQASPPQEHLPPRQRNMFGSLDPQQLMSMITNKGSFAGILGGLGNSNPQLSMLMGLMQNNSGRARKQSKEKKVEEIIVDEEKATKESPYKTVKDFYKENS